jgi:hypothetical protein
MINDVGRGIKTTNKIDKGLGRYMDKMNPVGRDGIEWDY